MGNRNMIRFEVLVLGNSSATPMFERHPTAQVVNFNEQYFLIDCGEGTQMQLSRYGIKTNRISHIFISHLHGDHYLGLVGLVSSMHLVGRRADLHIYGPEPLQSILDMHFSHSQTVIRYNIIFHITNPQKEELLFESRMLNIRSFPLVHRIPTTGFRFDEGKRTAILKADMVEKLNIPVAYYASLKKGVDYTDPSGQVFPALELTTEPPLARSYAFCSDTVRHPIYLPSIAGVNLLYHESTFLDEMLDRAVETFHTTAKQAAEIALETQADKLLLGHFSARYKNLEPLLQEAKIVFPNVELSQEGKWFLV